MKSEKKNVIVTGGASGIGKQLVAMLAGEGHTVGVLDKDIRAIGSLVKESPEVFAVPCDLVDTESIDKALKSFLNKYGEIHVLVNNAGIVRNSPMIRFEDGSLKLHDLGLWNDVIANNLNSVFYVSLMVMHHMVMNRIKGLIVNISSVASNGNAGQSAYSAAKAGVRSLTSAWAKEMSPFGIRVAAIAPGFTDTQTTMDNLTKTALDTWIKKTPSKRMATTSEIAESVLFIIKNDFFNGKTLEIDGGLTI